MLIVVNLQNKYFLKEKFRPVVGSLTEARGQKANIHVLREMLQLCEIIDSGGCAFDDEHPDLKVITFGELFDVSLK